MAKLQREKRKTEHYCILATEFTDSEKKKRYIIALPYKGKIIHSNQDFDFMLSVLDQTQKTRSRKQHSAIQNAFSETSLIKNKKWVPATRWGVRPEPVQCCFDFDRWFCFIQSRLLRPVCVASRTRLDFCSFRTLRDRIVNIFPLG